MYNSIFLSYRRDGAADLAGRIADRLRVLGYNVFFDMDAMSAGEFNRQIYDAIEQSSDVLLVLCENSLDRCTDENDWVRKEISHAIKLKKNIIPILMPGFSFPNALPEDMDNIRYLQGISAAPEWFDAMIEKLCSMLLAGCANTAAYLPAEREYYKISTPLINGYKDLDELPSPYIGIGALCEKILLSGEPLCREDDGDQAAATEYFRNIVSAGRNDSIINWFDKNKKRISDIRKMAVELKKHENLSLYVNALQFAIGTKNALCRATFFNHDFEAATLLCHCLDFPEEHYGALMTEYEKYGCGDRYFERGLPSSLLAISEMNSSAAAHSDDKRQFCTYAFMLFDLMVEISILVTDTVSDGDFIKTVQNRIRSYYKLLKSKKIYPPKSIQEKIHYYL